MPTTWLQRAQRILTPQRRVRFFVVLAFLFATSFGAITWQTARAERKKVMLGACYFAGYAASLLQSRAQHYLEAIAEPFFAAAIGGRAPTLSNTPLPTVGALRAADRTVANCHCAARLAALAYFRLTMTPDGKPSELTLALPDTTDSSLIARPTRRTVGEARYGVFDIDSARLTEAVMPLTSKLGGAGVVAASVMERPHGKGKLQSVAVLAPKYRMDGTLAAVYGVLVDPTTFAIQVVGAEFGRGLLFPLILASSGQKQRPGVWVDYPRNDQVANLAVLDMNWKPLYQTGPMADTAANAPGCVGLAPTEVAFASLMVNISPPPDVWSRWVQDSLVESYLPLLAAIGIAMLASVTAAVVGARREAELARLRSDFVSSVSHEMRMPLAQILMSGETLRLGRTRSQAQHDEEADSIVREAQHLTEVVDNALFFSRIEHHNLQLARRPVDLSDLVNRALANVRLLAEGWDVSVANDVPPHLYAELDPNSFTHVLVNLLDNAIKYGPPGQTIQVGGARSSRIPATLLLWIDDEGPGIPPSEGASIFQPFVRLPRDRNVGIAGSGLGLAVVHHLVTQHGGRIWVEQSNRGAGSRFVVELPAVTDAADVPHHTSNGDSRA